MGRELAVIDAIDVTGGSVARQSVGSSERRDRLAPKKVARLLLRFAEATVKRLP
jgi:hypothetical protein